jgi:ribose-phosphate pyrophosphokinase
VLSGPAAERILKSDFQEVVVTDTIPFPEEKRNGKFTVLSVAPLLGEAIFRIHRGQSVGELFS